MPVIVCGTGGPPLCRRWACVRNGSACGLCGGRPAAAKDPADRQQVTRYLYSHPEKFNLRLIPAPEGIDRETCRLTIASDEDWDHALAIYDALGPEALDWQRIAELLNHQPALRRRMAALNRECTVP